MGGFAWVTLATNDSYSLGALVLAHSLKQVGTKQQLVVLVTPGVTNSMREKLSQVFNLVQEVNILDSKDETNLKLLKRPELGITFTKLHCWRLTQYDKCVFLDADTLVLENCDELFDREELSAAPDVGWPDCFNSGVFVYRPSNDTYNNIVAFALQKGSFDGGDQGLLNLYFNDWAHKDISKHLPFIYNVCSTAVYSYLPAFKQFGGNAKIIHFIGASKPWLQYFDTETKKVAPSHDLQHLSSALQRWWDIFCSFIHSQLSPQMIRSSSIDNNDIKSQPNDPILNPNVNLAQLYLDYQPNNTKCVWDPWDEYDLRQEQSNNFEKNTIFDTVEPVETLNTNLTNSTDVVHHEINVVGENSNDNHVPLIPTYVESQIESQIIAIENSNPDVVPSYLDPNPIEQVIELTTTTTDCHDENTHEEIQEEAGLAGAFAQLTLGVPRSAEQNALEDHLRKQGWEVGNIDYLGRDSFENIWSKISETITQPTKVEEVTPATVVSSEEVKATTPVEPVVATAAPIEEKPAERTKVEETPVAPQTPVEKPPITAIVPVEAVKAPVVPQSPPIPLEAPPAPQTPTQVPQTPPIPLEAPPTPATPVEAPAVPVTPVEAPPVASPAAPAVEAPKQEPQPIVGAPACPLQKPEAPTSLAVAIEAQQTPPIPAASQEAPVCPLQKPVETPKSQEAPVCPLQKPAETPKSQEAPVCSLQKPVEAKEAQQTPASPVVAPEAPVCPLQKPAEVVEGPKTPAETPQTPVESKTPIEAPKTPSEEPKTPTEAPKVVPAAVQPPQVPPVSVQPATPVAEEPKTPETPAPAPVCQKPQQPKTEAKPSEESPACPVQKKPEGETTTPTAAAAGTAAPTPTPPPRKGSGPKKQGKSKK